MPTESKTFAIVRWSALVWMLTWLPFYLWVWGWQNMLHLCDVAVVLACLGLWFRHSLLVSSQALLAPLAGILWGMDVFWRVTTGHHWVGGTEYMWDSNYALWIRLLSLYHFVLPIVLLWAVNILGYDRRAPALQTAITGALLVLSRFLPRELNMNFAFEDPLLHRAWGPAPVHLIVILAGCLAIIFWPTHLLFMRVFPWPAKQN